MDSDSYDWEGSDGMQWTGCDEPDAMRRML